MYRLLIKGASQVVCISEKPDESFKNGPATSTNLNILEDSITGFGIVVDKKGFIVDIGETEAVLDKYCKNSSVESVFEKVIDAWGCSVIPGFVDCHTHACYAGDRLNEFVMKLQGASYLDIHRMGGGIHSTVRSTRLASEEDLYIELKNRLFCLLAAGTTTVEVKSGYGLDTATELKMLRVINRARKDFRGKLEVIATFCGAHAVPENDNPTNSTERVIKEMLPSVLKAKENESWDIQGGIDVFCEKGIFENEDTRRILEIGRVLGIPGNFHGDELSCTNAAELGAELGARAVSHLEEISEAGILALAKSAEGNNPTVGVLLPTTAYLLRLKVPPARQMINSGCCVALGSDFNPNAYCFNMSVVMNMACVLMRMTPAESLIGATLNSAAALGVSESRGSIVPGKLADFVILDTIQWENIIYQIGNSSILVKYVVKEGKVVYNRP